MQDAELLRLWASYDEKLEAGLRLHRRNAADITRIKVQSVLATMKPIKRFTLAAGLVWVAFLALVTLIGLAAGNPYLWVSAGAVGLLNTVAIIMYVYQLVMIGRTDLSLPVAAAQQRIVQLKMSTLSVTRILFLQLPFWTTFYLSPGLVAEYGLISFGTQIVVTGAFVWAAWWLFANIRFENRHKRWFQLLFADREWTPLVQSAEMLAELERDERGVSVFSSGG